LRPIKRMVEESLEALDDSFAKMYSSFGRPSIPPERLLKGLLLQVLFKIRNERELMKHIRFNLLYRWFVGLDFQDPVWEPSTFSKNRDRPIEADIAVGSLENVVAKADEEGLLSAAHFSVDGTRLEAYDARDFVEKCRANNVIPHVAQKKNSAIDGRTTRHEGYAVSLRKRKRIEEIFGWLKTAGCLRKTRCRGVSRVRWIFTFPTAAYNLLRMRNLEISAA